MARRSRGASPAGIRRLGGFAEGLFFFKEDLFDEDFAGNRFFVPVAFDVFTVGAFAVFFPESISPVAGDFLPVVFLFFRVAILFSLLKKLRAAGFLDVYVFIGAMTASISTAGSFFKMVFFR